MEELEAVKIEAANVDKAQDASSLEALLECTVCLSIVCQPISIACGHTFCRGCLVKTLSRTKKKCPTCRAICHVNAEDANENQMLKNLSRTLYPNLYAERLKDAEKEKESWSSSLPIFYYNDVLIPGATLSLHLFEPRYKLMMQRIVNAGRSFAYVPNFENYCASVGDVALIASISECTFMHDGRCLLEAKITSRVVITEHFVEDGTQGLHFCSFKKLEDIPITIDSEEFTILGTYVNQFHELMGRLDDRVKASLEDRFGPIPTSDPVQISFYLLAISNLRGHSKLELLKEQNTLTRFRAVIPSFAT